MLFYMTLLEFLSSTLHYKSALNYVLNILIFVLVYNVNL